jgi:hypothetical protein
LSKRHQQVGQLAADHLAAEQLGSSDKVTSHCAYQNAQSSAAPVDDPEHLVVDLGRLMQQRSDVGAALIHPDGLP